MSINFYDDMDFTANQSLAITKAISKLIVLLGGSNLIQKLQYRGVQF